MNAFHLVKRLLVLLILYRRYRSMATRPSYSVLSHDSWIDKALTPMRDWRIALLDVMPEIITEIQAEG